MQFKRTHRPSIIGKQGAVASNHPLATQAGLDILRAGGTAVDAAVAVSLTLGVVEPHMSGLGGDGFYHTLSGGTGEGVVYNGSGTAPLGLVLHKINELPLDGPSSVSVPGALAALGMMHAEQGTLAWADLLLPAIEAARGGFGVTQTYQRYAERAFDSLQANALSASIFLDQGEVPALGHFVVQERLARTLERLAQDGATSFYRGALADQMVRDFVAVGIPVNAQDMQLFDPQRQVPIATSYRGYEFRQTPPNSTGFVLLEALKIVEQFDFGHSAHLSAEVAHILIEAKKLAFIDRERYGADPHYLDIPLNSLLSDTNAIRLADRVDRAQAALLPVGTYAHQGNTTYFCVVDRHGNAVSAIQSLNSTFGSGVTLPESGIVMNNRMSCWHLDEAHPNRLVAGKRVRHTMNAPMILKNGKLWAVFGTPGADDQVQINLQIAVGLIDFDQLPQSVVEAPRWGSSQSGQDSNWPHGGGDILTVESDFPIAEQRLLRAKGHSLCPIAPLEGMGSASCIRVLDGGVYVAGSDPRRDGWAAAF